MEPDAVILFFVVKQGKLSFCCLVCRLLTKKIQCMSISICDVLSANVLVYIYLLCLFVLMFYLPIINVSNIGTNSCLAGFHYY